MGFYVTWLEIAQMRGNAHYQYSHLCITILNNDLFYEQKQHRLNKTIRLNKKINTTNSITFLILFHVISWARKHCIWISHYTGQATRLYPDLYPQASPLAPLIIWMKPLLNFINFNIKIKLSSPGI